MMLVHSHSYCMLIITGKGFCDAGLEAVELLASNATRIEVVTAVRSRESNVVRLPEHSLSTIG